ncbi:MAG: hypothetical protein L0191_02475 [Acidobacteria bacterium]|nr:hypothetical protein [Acidobacteriota bacterium]
MEGEEQLRKQAEEVLRPWQIMVAAWMDAMMRSTAFLTPGAPVLPWTTVFREQFERAVGMAVETSRFPGVPDLNRLSEEVGLLRAQTEALVTGLATLQAALQAQQQGWKTLEATVQQTAKVQEEAKRLFESWTAQWEERIHAMTRGVDEWRQRSEEVLREAMAIGQASQKGFEELTKTMWDLAKKFGGGS